MYLITVLKQASILKVLYIPKENYWEDGDLLLVDHKGRSHLSGTALVELDGALLELGLFIEGVPAEVDAFLESPGRQVR
jgi:hypothetical protein